jgi:para-nitrobenzyl esterase
MRREFLAWTILLTCAGCLARPEPAAVPPAAASVRTIAYRCPDHGGFRVSMAAAGTSVRLEGLASGPVTLPIVRSASGARYSDGRTTYWSRGAEATIERAGASPRVCTVIADPGMLPGTRWRLVRIQSMDDTEAVPDDRSKYTLEFGRAGALAGRVDCNRLSGRWTASGESISLGPLAMTRAMCPPGSLSDRYVRALEAAVTWMVVDGRLAIAMQVDAGILHFERMP